MVQHHKSYLIVELSTVAGRRKCVAQEHVDHAHVTVVLSYFRILYAQRGVWYHGTVVIRNLRFCPN